MTTGSALLLVLTLVGCGKLLGFEQDYVLREPIKVQFADQGERVTVPAGTRVTRTFTKTGVAFVQVYGTTDRQELDASGEAK
jgi:hypothetical protein